MVPQIAFWPVCGLPRGASLGRRQRRLVRLSEVILWVSPSRATEKCNTLPLRGRRAQIRFSRGARGEKPENGRPPYWLYGESIRTSVHSFAQCYCGSAIIGMPSCVFRFFTGRHSSGTRRRRAASARIYIYIYKEELKTVVRELLACTQPNRHETSTALLNPYHRVSLRGRRAQIRFSRGARGEKTENDRPPFWFTEKVYGLPCTVRTMLLWKRRHAIVRISIFYGAP